MKKNEISTDYLGPKVFEFEELKEDVMKAFGWNLKMKKKVSKDELSR